MLRCWFVVVFGGMVSFVVGGELVGCFVSRKRDMGGMGIVVGKVNGLET